MAVVTVSGLGSPRVQLRFSGVGMGPLPLALLEGLEEGRPYLKGGIVLASLCGDHVAPWGSGF